MAIDVTHLTSRGAHVRHSYHNDAEMRRFVRYAIFIMAVAVVARLIIVASQHVALLMPLGMLAAMLLSMVELAVTAAGIILAAIALCAGVGLSCAWVASQLRIARR